MKSVKHIFFDLDHTLWDFKKNAREALNEIFIDKQLAIRGVPSFDEFFARYSALNDHYWNLYRLGKISKDDLRYIRFNEALKAFKINDERLSFEIGNAYIALCPKKTNLFPYAIEVLEHLKAENLNLHIITNGFSEIQDIKMRESKLDSYFDLIVTPDNAGVKKPDPKIFQYALDNSNALANESVMIGDEPFIDVKGALDVGMKGIVFNPNQSKLHDFEEVSCLSDLKKIF